ncbi:MAG: sugar-binding domain-containing protein [bacterium]
MGKAAGAGPTEMVLAARVARMHLLEDLPKTEIADRLSISRFRVARLLEAAREMGMVHIEIGMPGVLDAALSAELASRFDLRYAYVYDFPDDDVSLRRRLGSAAGAAVSDFATGEDVIGIAWARSLFGLARELTRFPSCELIQMSGALARFGGEDLLDLVRSLTRLGAGPARAFYAPMIVDDAATAMAIRRHPDVAAAFDRLGTLTIGLVGIGSWTAGLSSIYDALDDPDRAAVAAAGVRADVSGVFLDPHGAVRATPLDERMIVTPPDVLAAIPVVLAVAYDKAKAPAVWAALQGGTVNALVTHASLARAVLEYVPDPSLGADQPVAVGAIRG